MSNSNTKLHVAARELHGEAAVIGEAIAEALQFLVNDDWDEAMLHVSYENREFHHLGLGTCDQHPLGHDQRTWAFEMDLQKPLVPQLTEQAVRLAALIEGPMGEGGNT